MDENSITIKLNSDDPLQKFFNSLSFLIGATQGRMMGANFASNGRGRHYWQQQLIHKLDECVHIMNLTSSSEIFDEKTEEERGAK